MNQGPLLERRSPFGIPYALLILTVFFFFLPFAFRGARLSLGERENDVKDWLPSDFPETAELEWFADHFAGESFVLATWPGCTSGDQRLKLFESKLLHECDTYDPSFDFPLELAETYARAKQIGNELELLPASRDFLNWGGKQEKWIRASSGQWYYILPDGQLYRWEEATNGPAGLSRAVRRAFSSYELNGQFVAAFGEEPVERVANPFYNDTTILCASLFHTVQTGDSIVAELASEGGPLWPIDLTDESRREVVAQRRAMERLTGTLFAPAVPNGFSWTPEAFREAYPEAKREQLPAEFDALVQYTLQQVVDDDFGGSLQRLKTATQDEQTAAWYEVFDTIEVEPPPRLTCVLVTLTDLAKDNLSYALGRGMLGEPRGRILQLAEESGVRPPAPPSLAPPPFNREAPITVAGIPSLRMGGPPVDNMAIDEEGTVTLVRLVGYSIVIGVVLSFICFGSLKITVMVFVVGGTSAVLSMAMVWWTAGRVDAVLMSMPSLVYVLGLSGAIHVVNYYRDEVRAHGKRGAPGRALRHALLPCTLASVTTAIGLVSLFTSNLAPISNFGLYSAIGVIMTLGVLFSYLPAALQTFSPKFKTEKQPDTQQVRPEENRLSEWWAGAGRWITGHHVLVSSTCLLVLVVASLGLLNIKTSVQLLKLFDPESRIIDDYAWLETNFGKLVPMELIVRIPPSMQAESDTAKSNPNSHSLEMLERVEAVSRIRTAVRRTLGETGRQIVGQEMSADTFLPPLPAPTNNYNPVRAKFNRELIEASETLRDNDYLRIEKSGAYADSELWRISLRVAALSNVDYGQFIGPLRESVEPVLRAYETRDELLDKLTDKDTGKLPTKTRVLVVGSERPSPLIASNLLSEDGEIDGRTTYLATFNELLSAERIETPTWIDPDPAKAAQLTAKKGWKDFVARYNAVIWLDGNAFSKSDFSTARSWIDADEFMNREVHPILSPGRIPDVEGSGPIQVVYTGVVPVVYKAQRTLLTSLTHSIALAFVLIAVVMIFLLNPGRTPLKFVAPANVGNGIGAGMVSMIPNVFPVLLVFGVMCHRGVEIDIGTMMTASVAMGVAVDDTIHFLSWFRKYLDQGMNRIDAIIETYRRVGPAMTQTTIVGGLGLFVFALSTFTPTQRFGVMMLVMLAAALVGDLILLPALLAGPVGRFFKPRDGARYQPEEVHLDDADEPEEQSVEEEDEMVPHLKVHFPTERTDSAHGVRKSVDS